jgi:serine phosphatase RsbU (regulator of sigma subunit)
VSHQENEHIRKLTTLNQIAHTLNRAVDVKAVLDDTLARLVQLMGLKTGWVFLREADESDQAQSRDYVLAAHHNLPPALSSADAWQGTCNCQQMCAERCGDEAYNQIDCSRLSQVQGERHGLAMHASVPLRSGDRILGILNVAAPDWSSFDPEALALLTTVGSQIGVALERARLYDLLQERRVEELATLLDFSNQLLSRPDLSDLLQFLVSKVRQVLKVDACALLLPDSASGALLFQASTGWRADPVAAGRQIPPDEESGLMLVLHGQQPLMAEDIAHHDPVPWLPDWLRAEGFRGHAVVPLLAERRSVGVLVINTRQPRVLDENEIRLLRLMGNQAAIAIEKARLHQEELERQRLEQELTLGRQIQLSMLPEMPTQVPGWEFASFYQAARIVGGDLYDLFRVPGEPHKIGLVIADVAGKGVAAALFMTHCRTIIRATALDGRNPAATLVRSNELIMQEDHSQLFVTVFYALLDTKTGRLVFANAGHPHPLHLHANSGGVEALVAPGIALGAVDEIELAEQEIRLAPGDLLLLYTDAVTEAMDTQYQPFGRDRLESLLAGSARRSARQVIRSVVDAVEAYAGDISEVDDMTLLALKREL